MDCVYEPAEDSELLLEVALREVRAEDEVIEIGGGSGFVSGSLRDKCRFIIATDISPAAARVMARKGIDVVVTDVADGIRKRFSLILFNPPYLELEEEEKKGDFIDLAINGGKGGKEIMLKFLDSLGAIMRRDGRAILIVSTLTDQSIFDDIVKKGYRYEIIAEKNLFFEKLFAVKITFDRCLNQS